MKRYVFFTNSIRNMGGGQMYIRNKIMFLKNYGWTPTVFYYTEGKILIPELQEFKDNRKPELAFPITTVSEKKRKKIIDKISLELQDAEECVIESHIYPGCYWMEEVAKIINGRHILFILHERFPKLNSREEDFFKFKLDRGELMMGPVGIKKRLNKNWINNTYFTMPSYSNVTAPIKYTFEYDKSLKNILSLGRLDKPYILPMIKEINSFCETNDFVVNLFFVGGAANEKYIDEIRTYLKGRNKIIPYFLGYMYPVPECIIKSVDVAIASSGSILVPAEFGIPTIAIDTQDFMAMGIYGVTTNNTFVRKTEPKQYTSELLKDVLINDKYKTADLKVSSSNEEKEKILMKHLDIIESLRAPKVYYEVFTIFNKREIINQKIIRYLYQIFGEVNIGRIAKFKNKVVNLFRVV